MATRLERSATLLVSDKTNILIDQLELHGIPFIQKLKERGVRFALIGGLAVSIRTVERLTKDMDLAIAVSNDAEAEELVMSLSRSGYFVETLIEQDDAKRLSTVRMISKGEVEMFIDLLFASSGIEAEVVASAEESEIFLGVSGLVATIPSLIALKVLSANPKRRMQDIIDLQYLIKKATTAECETARDLMRLITERGFNRNKDLLKDFDRYIEQFSD